MNKKITLLGISAVACLFSMSSCTSVGEHNSSSELYYTNATSADKEEYAFLRTVYQLANDEIGFANVIATKGSNAQVKGLAANLSAQYKEVAAKLEELGTQSDVLIPQSGFKPFELPAALDSAQADVLEKAFLEQSLHNQEIILHQFETVEKNTKKAAIEYAKETLPALEKSKEEIQALL